jgi:hypothetical protein
MQVHSGEPFGSSQRVLSVVIPGQCETAFFHDIFRFYALHAGVEVPILLSGESDKDDQGLSDNSITPRCCMSSNISPKHACFTRGGFLWVWQISSGLRSIYTAVHSVAPSIVIALHIKDISALFEEPFQLLEFRVTQVWACSYNRVPQLGPLFWTCGCSTLGEVTSVTISRCARRGPFVNSQSRRVAFSTLLGTSRRSWTRALAM